LWRIVSGPLDPLEKAISVWYRRDIYRRSLGVAAQRKSHQTTIRFSEEQWQQLEAAANTLEMSVAQYIREAARARLDGTLATEARADPRQTLDSEAEAAKVASRDRVQDSSALWEQGRQARVRAAELREESVRQRRRHGGDDSPFNRAEHDERAQIGG
jgi:predicted DNA-binding protein